MTINHQWQLAQRPSGEASTDNFAWVSAPIPSLLEGQVLVRHHFLSLDPYMRGRMNDSKSYVAPQPLNSVMIGGTVGEVVDSRHAKFAPGDRVVGMGGWQDFSVVHANELGLLRKVDTTHVPLSHYLGAVGMPGVTAWYGLVKIIAPKAGETVTVSAASGAVGALDLQPQVAVVGLEGGDEVKGRLGAGEADDGGRVGQVEVAAAEDGGGASGFGVSFPARAPPTRDVRSYAARAVRACPEAPSDARPGRPCLSRGGTPPSESPRGGPDPVSA